MLALRKMGGKMGVFPFRLKQQAPGNWHPELVVYGSTHYPFLEAEGGPAEKRRSGNGRILGQRPEERGRFFRQSGRELRFAVYGRISHDLLAQSPGDDFAVLVHADDAVNGTDPLQILGPHLPVVHESDPIRIGVEQIPIVSKISNKVAISVK